MILFVVLTYMHFYTLSGTTITFFPLFGIDFFVMF